MTDWYGIVAVQVVLVALLLFSFRHSVRTRRSRAVVGLVRRGPESRAKLGGAYGFASVLLLQAINASEAFQGHKVLLSLTDIGALFYLCFLSGWFRNKVIGWIGSWENGPERH